MFVKFKLIELLTQLEIPSSFAKSFFSSSTLNFLMAAVFLTENKKYLLPNNLLIMFYPAAYMQKNIF